MALGLLDLLAPYFFAGYRPPTGSSLPINLGGIYDDVVGALSIREVDTCWDDDAVCLWGRAGFTDPTQAHHTTPQGEVFDWNDVEVRFRLTASRAESSTLASAVSSLGSSDPLSQLITALGGTATGSDAPTTSFRLDLLITAVTLHLPSVRPAQLTADGLLAPDATHHDVTLTLPKILVTITQGATVGSVDAELDSWGATGLDTEADLAEGTCVTQDPPYALVGTDNSLWGWGFSSAVVDFSDSHTPPEILAIAGTGDDWKGIYFPELRVFLAPAGIRGLAVDVGAKDLLIGIGPGGGVSGDFDIEVVNQQGAVSPTVRFQTGAGNRLNPGYDGIDAHGAHIGKVLDLAANGTVIVDVSGGQPPYTVTINGAVQPTHSLGYTGLADGSVFTISVTDSGPSTRPAGSGSWSASITAHVKPGTATSTSSSTAPTSTAPNVTLVPSPTLGHQVAVAPGADADHVVLVVSPTTSTTSTVTLSLDGTTLDPPGADGRVSIQLQHDDATAHSLEVDWTGQSVPPQQTVYFPKDKPAPLTPYSDDAAWSDRALMYDGPVPDDTSPGIAMPNQVDVGTLRTWASNYPDGTTFTATGQASHEPGTSNSGHNQPLADRRSQVAAQALSHAIPDASDPPDSAHRQYTATAPTGVYDSGNDDPATLTTLRNATIVPVPATPTSTSAQYAGTLQRQLAQPPAHVDTPAGATPPPSWFRSIGIIVRLVQNVPVACEIKGVLWFSGLADQQLQRQNAGNQLPAGGPSAITGSNRADHGLASYDLTTEWDTANGDFRVDLVLAGGDGTAGSGTGTTGTGGTGTGTGTGTGGTGTGTGGTGTGTSGTGNATSWLWQTQPLTDPANNPNDWLDFAGLLTTLMPVLTVAAGDGDAVQGMAAIAIGTGAVIVVTEFHVIHTTAITIWGGELLVERSGENWQSALLLDLEADLWFNVSFGSTPLLRLPPESAMKVRYKAAGVRFSDNNGAMELAPAFDPSRGYELSAPNLSAIQMPGALGELMHLLAVRIASLNPLQIETDIGLKVNLGVVSVDRARIRLTLPQAEGESIAITLTALAASVSIPGVLKGTGSLAIDPTGFDGSLDLALTSIGVRIAATLDVHQIQDPATNRNLTAVFASLEVDFPAAIPLLQTGLGIYGFLGMFGMHYGRTENPPTSSDDNPALDWLLKAAPGGDVSKTTGPAPTNAVLWQPEADHWAVGLGIVLGTMEGGTILNLQGVVIIELPGPRLVIYVKAKFLQPRSATNSQVSGTITALVEISPDGFLIGIIVDYAIQPILTLRVPIGAHFSFSEASDYQIDIGTYPAPATARVFNLFDATAFVEIHGDQIDNVPPLGTLPGLAIAAGIHASIVWGVQSSGLYLKVTADALLGVSFSPFQFLGIFSLQGQLHLWIVTIEASASLDIGALTTDGSTNFWMTGQVCGEVDFMFFSVKGCISVSLGDQNPLADAPPLVSGLALQARTASPVQGTATAQRPVGAALATADTPSDPTQTAAVPGTAPVDTIPVLTMETAPLLAAGFTTLGTPPQPAPPAQGNGWARRGQAEYQYTLTSVSLTASGGAAMTADGVQSVFRTGNKTSGDDTTVQYALLDWSPDPADQIMLVGPANDNRIGTSWGWVCTDVAAPATVLWTFQPCAPGPSLTGWQVTGTAFPDAPGTRRSRPAPTLLNVSEPWRSGRASVDALLGIEPARIDQVGFSAGTPLVLKRPAVAVRALAAPFERPLVNRGDDLDKFVAELRHVADADGLLDAVDLSAGAARQIRMLLTVAGAALKSQWLVIRPLDENGQPLGADIPVLPGSASIPPEWTSPGFAAAGAVTRSVEYSTVSRSTGHQPVLVDAKLPDGTVTVRLGLTRLSPEAHAVLPWPSFTVCVVELALVAEDERVSQDNQDASNAQQTITTQTTSDPASRPLLHPGTEYVVTVDYEWQGRHVGDTAVARSDSTSQSFSFTTDTDAPASLEPWLLATFPSQGETFHFTDDAPVVCFASDDVDQLAGAYGQTIHAHVVPARTDLQRTSQPIGALLALNGIALTTFEHTLQRLHETVPAAADSPVLPCIDIQPGPRHGQATVAAPLDPSCDYVLDLSYDATVTTPAQNQLGMPLLRRGFSTGRYANPVELANDVAASALEHRSVTGFAAAFAGMGSAPVTDTQLDTALAAAGLGAVAPPTGPRLVLLWATDTSPAAPVAVLIDAPEPIWRTRLAPQQHPADSTGTTWWELDQRDWLTVAAAPSRGEFGTSDPDQVPITGIVRNNAGTRVICLLGDVPAASTTPKVSIVLSRSVDPTGVLDPPGTPATTSPLVAVELGGAPWEATS
jgi:large repetitive protein